MEIFDNITRIVRDDLKETIKRKSRVSVAAACFSMYAYSVLKKQLESVDEFRFIFTSPTFIAEKTAESSDAYKLGYLTICGVGKERIRRAGLKIKEDSPLTTMDLDAGFRVFKLDSSNMNDVYYAAGDYTQDLLTMLESNVKSDRTDLDLLFGCLLGKH